MYEDTKRDPFVRRHRSHLALIGAFLAGATLSAVVTALVVQGGTGSGHVVASSAGGAPTSATTTTTAPDAVTAAPTTTVTPPPTETSSSSPVTTASTTPAGPGESITGMVTDSAGHPLSGAYVIGLDSLTVARTDPTGHFAMPCKVSSGAITANRTEPMVASAWLAPVLPNGQGGFSYGSTTTTYGPPPTTPGPGYAFSGGASDAAQATTVTCNGRPVNFVLPAGGGADVQFVDSKGAPATSFSGPPVDNLYLPGLGEHAALETAPLSSDGHQVLEQLGPGTLGLDVLYPMTCTTSGGTQLAPDPSGRGLGVIITPGQVTHVICRLSGSTGSTSTSTSTSTTAP